MRLSLLAALLGSAALASASAHPSAPFEYHAHQSFLKNGTALAKRASSSSSSCPSKVIAQYVPAWTNGATEKVDWGRTDLAFFFCTLTSSSGIELAAGTTESGMRTFISAATSAGRKPLLTVGGWSGSVYFSSLVATSSSRTAFANTVKTWLDEYGFAGVDLDWEFVGRQGAGSNIVSSADAANYLLFLQTLRSTLGSDAIITAAVPASGFTGPDGAILTDLSGFAKVFNYVVLMAYDYYGAWSATTGPNAPLYTCNAGSDSADDTLSRWLAFGFAPCQIMLGIPSYSHTFSTASSTIATTTYNGKKTTAFQAQGSGDVSTPADGTSVNGLVAAGYLSADLSTGLNGWTRYYDSCTATPFLFNPSKKVWVTYDDEQSWTAKADYAKSKGLAGIAIYESSGGTSEMLAAVASALGHSSGSTTTTRTSAGPTSTTTTSSAPSATKTCSASNDCSAESRPANSNAYCKSGLCSFRCRTGFTQSGSECLSTATTSSSSSSSTTTSRTTTTTTTSAPAATKTCASSSDCSAEVRPANSNAFCKNGLCSFRCRTGFTQSGSECLSTATTSSSFSSSTTTSRMTTTSTTSAPAATKTCASSSDCSAEPRPANSNAYCRNNLCSFRCRSHFTQSGNLCLSTSAASSSTTTTTTTTTSAAAAVKTCSASNDCASESRPANSNAYCKNGLCSFRCRSGYTLTDSSTCVSSSARRFARARRAPAGFVAEADEDALFDLEGFDDGALLD
ncbi:hypothetical protein JCM8547_005872 [Rhodosporidiobolus lusitaniae]